MAKRYFWLKLENGFFKAKQIKKLRKQAGGDTYTLIALEIALMSLPNDGIIAFDGLEDDIAEEIALEIDEETDNVKVTLNYLLKIGWAEILDDDSVLLTYAVERTGSESTAAERMRKMREMKKSNDVTPQLQETSQCDNVVTVESNNVTDTRNNVTLEKSREDKSRVDLESDSETELNSETESERDSEERESERKAKPPDNFNSLLMTFSMYNNGAVMPDSLFQACKDSGKNISELNKIIRDCSGWGEVTEECIRNRL